MCPFSRGCPLRKGSLYIKPEVSKTYPAAIASTWPTYNPITGSLYALLWARCYQFVSDSRPGNVQRQQHYLKHIGVAPSLTRSQWAVIMVISASISTTEWDKTERSALLGPGLNCPVVNYHWGYVHLMYYTALPVHPTSPSPPPQSTHTILM